MASPFEQFRHAGTPVLPKAALPTGHRPEIWADWTAEWLDYYTQEPTPLTCLIPAIDADQEQSLKGKLAVLIGTGGTRKSYYLKQVLATNILSYGSRVVYSSMEMGKPEVVNRFLDMVIAPEGGECASSFLRRAVREDREAVAEYLASCAAVLHDNLVLSNNSGKTVADYEKMILDTQAAYGPVDILAIDGLSAMGGQGEETARFNQITLDLKELAKKYNLFIMLVCHTSKGAKGYSRDSREFVRGSEKILDNADFSMCFSNIIDWRQSTPDNILFIRHLAHIKYYNKRGSGMMLNQLMEFDGLTKSFSVSPGLLMDFPDYDTFVREYNAEKRKAERRDNPSF